MKNLLAIGLLTVALSSGVVNQPAHADDADTAAKNARRAQGQEYKADRAASRGDTYSAMKHEANARRDEHKARKDERRALRKGEY